MKGFHTTHLYIWIWCLHVPLLRSAETRRLINESNRRKSLKYQDVHTPAQVKTGSDRGRKSPYLEHLNLDCSDSILIPFADTGVQALFDKEVILPSAKEGGPRIDIPLVKERRVEGLRVPKVWAVQFQNRLGLGVLWASRLRLVA